ncbi:MAG TPA: LysM peptidoglycan-binding domain-containing protein [Chlamydiales bacterium]|nr:LysM peptidoglycan-binding domain-containing protein [Chlamydiales bacterium]
MKNKLLILVVPILFFSSCSPLKSTARESKHQMELTLQEMRTKVDDLRHDIHCFKTEMEILEGKIKHHENTLCQLKVGYVEKQEERWENMFKEMQEIKKKLVQVEQGRQNELKDIKQLSSHANETTFSLTQFKEKIEELEKQFSLHSRKYDEMLKLKGTLETLSLNLQKESNDSPLIKIYKVRAGDSLEKIAKAHQTNSQYLKKINQLEKDLIQVGQEIKVPAK